MTWTETLRTGWAAVRTHAMRSILTVLGILIGIAAVILTVGLGLGTQQDVSEQISSLGSNLLIVTPGSAAWTPRASAAAVRLARDTDQVGRGCPRLRGERSRRVRRCPGEVVVALGRDLRDQLDHDRRRHDRGLARRCGRASSPTGPSSLPRTTQPEPRSSCSARRRRPSSSARPTWSGSPSRSPTRSSPLSACSPRRERDSRNRPGRPGRHAAHDGRRAGGRWLRPQLGLDHLRAGGVRPTSCRPPSRRSRPSC